VLLKEWQYLPLYERQVLWTKQKERKAQELKVDKEFTQMKELTFQPQMLSKQFNVASIAQPIFQQRRQAESYAEIHKNKLTYRNSSAKRQAEVSPSTRTAHNVLTSQNYV
jgi:hypothetical protein